MNRLLAIPCTDQVGPGVPSCARAPEAPDFARTPDHPTSRSSPIHTLSAAAYPQHQAPPTLHADLEQA